MKNLTTMDPRSDVYDDPSAYTGPYSRVLRFGLAAGMYLLLSVVQVILNWLLSLSFLQSTQYPRFETVKLFVLAEVWSFRPRPQQ